MWRVYLAGHRVASPFPFDMTLLVCDVCKARLQAEYDAAGGLIREAVTA